MKVLLVAHIGYPWGGVSQRYSDLLGSSLPRKIDLTFLESSPNKRSISSTGRLNFQNTLGFFSVCFNFVVTLIKLKPSIVHIASSFGYSFLKNSILVIIATLFGCKVILAPHCSVSVFVPKTKVLFNWMKYVLNKCDGLIVLSNEWMDIQKIAPKTRVILLKNSINLQSFLKIQRSIKRQTWELRIVYLGHIGSTKGIMDLIQSVDIINKRRIRGFKVSIYGEEMRPGELNKAKELVRNLKIENLLSFYEPVFGDKKLKVFQDADIFILPSHHEGLPISIIEAMAAGLPVIGTTVGGIPDLIDDFKSGILVAPKSPEYLADAIKTLIADQELRYRFGSEGRKKAMENHDVETYVDHLRSFYQDLL